jgi:hypothetical protein
VTETFGRSIISEFYALSDDEYINLPSQVPAIHLFDAYPSALDAQTGTGALQTKDFWTHSDTDPFKRQVALDPVDDPDPTGAVVCRGYWLAFNYIINNAGQKLTSVRELIIQRPETQDSVVPTDAQDLKDLWPWITSYYSDDSKLTKFIDLAISKFKLDLRRRDIDWGRVQRLKEIGLPIAYKALAIAMDGQQGRHPDLPQLVGRWEAEYSAGLASIKLPVDENLDGKAALTAPVQNSVRIGR